MSQYVCVPDSIGNCQAGLRDRQTTLKAALLHADPVRHPRCAHILCSSLPLFQPAYTDATTAPRRTALFVARHPSSSRKLPKAYKRWDILEHLIGETLQEHENKIMKLVEAQLELVPSLWCE